MERNEFLIANAKRTLNEYKALEDYAESLGKAESTYLYSRIIFQLEVLLTLIDPNKTEEIEELKNELKYYQEKREALKKQKALHLN